LIWTTKLISLKIMKNNILVVGNITKYLKKYSNDSVSTKELSPSKQYRIDIKRKDKA